MEKDDEMELVIIESPFKGEDWEHTKRNILYARLCVSYSLSLGEAPFASHLFYTQTGILRDDIPEERMRGIHAGFTWGDRGSKRIICHDFGISKGMEYGIKRAETIGQPLVYRLLSEVMNLEEELDKLSKIKPPLGLELYF